jgi:hypothetical protein
VEKDAESVFFVALQVISAHFSERAREEYRAGDQLPLKQVMPKDYGRQDEEKREKKIRGDDDRRHFLAETQAKALFKPHLPFLLCRRTFPSFFLFYDRSRRKYISRTRTSWEVRAGGKADRSLVRLIVKAHALKEKLGSGHGLDVGGMTRRWGTGRCYVTRLLRLTFLAPDITKAILEGRHPRDLSAARLMRSTRFPLSWREQREVLGFA